MAVEQMKPEFWSSSELVFPPQRILFEDENKGYIDTGKGLAWWHYCIYTSWSGPFQESLHSIALNSLQKCTTIPYFLLWAPCQSTDKVLLQLLRVDPLPCQGRAPLPYPEAFILPSRNIIPIRFFLYQKVSAFLCTYCDLLHAKQLNKLPFLVLWEFQL